MQKHSIYALCEPGTLDVRYVGRTAWSLEWRLISHVTQAKKGTERNQKRPAYAWIDSVRQSGKRPDIILLARCEETIAADAERAWITLFIDNGYDLVNVRDRNDKRVRP